MKHGECATRPLANDVYCTSGIFFLFSFFLYALFISLAHYPFSPHFSLSLSSNFFLLDLLMCIVIRSLSRSRCSSSLGFEAWMYSLLS
jgi:hypothetical protein